MNVGNTTDKMTELIAAELFKHRLVTDHNGRSICKCGWYVSPLLDSVHRLHQGDQILAAVLMATAQIAGENASETRSRDRQEWQNRTHAVGLLLLDSGDITPMGTRILDKIWETSEANT